MLQHRATWTLFAALLALGSISLLAERPNIIVFLTDDQDKESIGAYGGEVWTPNLDSMVREGMLFHNGFFTSTVCTPSRYSFLTGRYASRSTSEPFRYENPEGHQTFPSFNMGLESDNLNVADVLSKAGYRTGFVGKYHASGIESLSTDSDYKKWGLKYIPRDEPVCSCAEEHVLGFEGDLCSSQNILIHEFSHDIRYRGMDRLDPTLDSRLQTSYERAMELGLWEGRYASANHSEYSAECVQSWFDKNRQPDHDHNHVDTRKELKEFDPGLAALCEEVFGDTVLIYTKPATRLQEHLDGYDLSSAPEFVWPESLLETKRAIREEAEARGKEHRKKYVH